MCPLPIQKLRESLAMRVNPKDTWKWENLRMPHSSWITFKTHLSEIELEQMSRGKNGQAYPFMFWEELVLVFR